MCNKTILCIGNGNAPHKRQSEHTKPLVATAEEFVPQFSMPSNPNFDWRKQQYMTHVDDVINDLKELEKSEGSEALLFHLMAHKAETEEKKKHENNNNRRVNDSSNIPNGNQTNSLSASSGAIRKTRNTFRNSRKPNEQYGHGNDESVDGQKQHFGE